MSKPPKIDSDSSLRGRAITRLVDAANQNDESLLKLVEILGKSPEDAAEVVQARAERRRKWWDLPVVVTIATATSSLVTIALQGGVDVWKQRDIASHEFQIEDMKLTRAAFEKLMYVDPESYLVFSADAASLVAPGDAEANNEVDAELAMPIEPSDENDDADGTPRSNSSNAVSDGVRKGFLAWAEVERRNRLCVAVDFGIIQIPDDFLESFPGENSYQRVSAFMKDYQCDRGTLPTETPLIEVASGTESVAASGCERVALELGGQLPVPNGLTSENPNHVALRAAINERNSGVHERDCRQRLDFYSTVVGLPVSMSSNTPWSAVFTSFLLMQTGNPAGIQQSLRTSDIWASARRLGKAYVGIEGVQVGDIVFRLRRDGPDLDMSEVVKAIQTGEFERPWFGSSGIVYSIDETRMEMVIIGGNVSNMVKEISVKLDDPTVIGFVRQ